MYTYSPDEYIQQAKLRIGDISLQDYINSANAIIQNGRQTKVDNTTSNVSYSTGQVVGDTLGDIAYNVFNGLSKAFEGIADFGAGLVGTFAKWSGDKTTEQAMADYVARDTTNEYVWNGLFKGTDQDFEASAINKMSETGQNIVRGVSQGVGGMIPTIAISLISRGAGASAGVASFASLTQMGISAAGTATEEALNDGENVALDRAFLYGIANGAMEIATETIIGGAYEGIFGKGLLDGVVKNLSKNVKFGKLIGWLVNNLGEGVEEIVSAVFEDTLKTIYNSDKIHWVAPDIQNVIESGIVGSLTAVVMGGATNVLSRVSSSNTIGMSLQNINENNEWASNLQTKGRYDEVRAANVQQDNEKQLRTIEKRLKMMSEVKRAKIMSKMPQLYTYFKQDGTRIEKQSLAAGANSDIGNLNLARQNGTYDARITDGNEIANTLYQAEQRLSKDGKVEHFTIAEDLNEEQKKNVEKIKDLNKLSGRALRLVVYQSDLGENTRANAFIKGDTMYVVKDNLLNKEDAARAWAHEVLGHFTEETTLHSLFVSVLKESNPDLYRRIVNQINNESFYTESEKKSEIEALLIEEIVGTNQDIIDRLYARNKNILVKLLDTLKNIGKALKSYFTDTKEGEVKKDFAYYHKINAMAKMIEATLSQGGTKLVKDKIKEDREKIEKKKGANVELAPQFSYNKNSQKRKPKSYYSQWKSDALAWANNSKTLVGDRKTGHDSNYIYFYEAVDSDNIGRVNDFIIIGRFSYGDKIINNLYEEIKEHNDRNHESNERNDKGIYENIDEYESSRNINQSNNTNGLEQATTNGQNSSIYQGESKSNRISNVDKGNGDIQLSLKIGDKDINAQGEETSKLVAIHNLGEKQLLKVLDLGGFAMPSIAVTKANIPHDNFGDVTIIFDKDTIDPQKSTKNRVYERDAWTPTIPSIDVKLNSKQISSIMQNITKKVKDNSDYYFDVIHFFDEHKNYAGEYVLKENEFTKDSITHDAQKNVGILASYLSNQKNKDLSPVYKEKYYHTHGFAYVSRTEAKEILDALGIDKPIDAQHVTNEERQELLDKYINYKTEKTYEELKDNPSVTKQKILSAYKHHYDIYSINDILFMSEEFYGDKDSTKYDMYATRDKLFKQIDNIEDFNNWIWDEFSTTYEKKGIRNDADPYTSMGHYRSFEALHYEYTLENLLKKMSSGEQTGQAWFGAGQSAEQLAAKLAKQFKSIKDIREAKDILKKVSEEERDEYIDSTYELYSEIKNEIDGDYGDTLRPDASAWRRDGISDIISSLAEARPITIENIKRVWERETRGYDLHYTFNDEIANKILTLFEMLQQIPTTYFEAKPKRAVGINEIQMVLLPENASQDLITKLEDKGIPYQKYNGEDGERSKIIQSMDNIQFSLARQDLDEGAVTDSPYEIYNLITNKSKPYRILYDANIDKYFIGNAESVTHFDMLEKAIQEGYYANNPKVNKIFDSITYMQGYDTRDLVNGIYNYFDTGTDGLYEDGLEIDPYLTIMYYAPNDEDAKTAYADGYDETHKGEIGTILTRGTDFKDSGLLYTIWNKWNKYNDSKYYKMSPETKELYKQDFDGYSVKKVNIQEILDKNNISSKRDAIQSRRKDVWGKTFEDYHIDKNKLEDTLSIYSPIRLTNDGKIIDGTHRLIAFKNDGYKTADVLVSRGKGIQFSLSNGMDSTGDYLSKGQMEYFKDSKVRNKDGHLLVLYHGTDSQFNIFDKDVSQKAFFFTNNHDVAHSYGNTIMPVYVNIKKPYIIDAEGRWWSNILDSNNPKTSAFLDLEFMVDSWETDEYEENIPKEAEKLINKMGYKVIINPEYTEKNGYYKYFIENENDEIEFRVDNAKELINELAYVIEEQSWDVDAKHLGFGYENTRGVVERILKTKKYDGIIIKNLMDMGGKVDNITESASDIYIVFEPNQIKSIINMNPSENDDIRFSLKTNSDGQYLTNKQEEFFKDTKVVDDKGRLLVVYHGTDSEFTSFNKSAGQQGRYGSYGIYFADKETASGYGDRVMPVYLNIKNALRIDADGAIATQIPNKIVPHDEWKYPYGILSHIDDISSWAEEKGYDGVIVENVRDNYRNDEDNRHIGNVYIVFEPNQIKSINNLNPTEDNDIRFSIKGIHWGDLDYGRKADRKEIMGGRGTGHFGTGFYFVSEEKYGDMHEDYNPRRPIYEIDFDKYNLFKPKTNDEAFRLHDGLKDVNDAAQFIDDLYYDEDDAINKMEHIYYNEEDMAELVKSFVKFAESNGIARYVDFMYNYTRNEMPLEEFVDFITTEYFKDGENGAYKMFKGIKEAIEWKGRKTRYLEYSIRDLSKILGINISELKKLIKKADITSEKTKNSVSTELMKSLGYEGVGVYHLTEDDYEAATASPDNFQYGSVIYDLKPNTYKRIQEPRESIQFSLMKRDKAILKTREDVKKAAEDLFFYDEFAHKDMFGVLSKEAINKITDGIIKTAPSVPENMLEAFCYDIADMIVTRATYDDERLFDGQYYDLKDLQAKKKEANKYLHSFKFSDSEKAEIRYRMDKNGAKSIFMRYSNPNGVGIDTRLEYMYEAIGSQMPDDINNEMDLFFDWLDKVNELDRAISLSKEEAAGRYTSNQTNMTEEQRDAIRNNIREKLADALAPLLDVRQQMALGKENILAEEEQKLKEKLQQKYDKLVEQNKMKLEDAKKQMKEEQDRLIERVRNQIDKDVERKTKKVLEQTDAIVENARKHVSDIKQENGELKRRFKALKDITKRALFFRKESLKKYPDSSMLGDEGVEQAVSGLARLSSYGYAGGRVGRDVIADFVEKFYNPQNEMIKDWFDQDLYDDLVEIANNRQRTTKSGKKINNAKDLSYAEIAVIDKAIKAAEHIVRTYNKILVDGQYQDLDAKAEESVKTMQKFKGMIKDSKLARMFRYFVSNSIEPRVVIKWLFGMQNNILSDLYEDIGRGETKGQALELHLAQMLQDFYKKHKKYGKSLTSKITFRGKTMTKGQFLTLVKYYEQDHSNDAVLYTGWAIKNEKTNKYDITNGLIDTKNLLSQEELELPQDERDKLLEERKAEASKGVAKEMYDLLTEEDKEYLNLISDIMEEGAKYQIDTDILFKGFTDIDPTKSRKYLPIRRYGKDFKVDSFQAVLDSMKIDQAGNQTISKKRTQNRKHLELHDIDALVLDYAHKLGVYYGLAVPIKEFQRAYNFNTSHDLNKPVSIRNTLAQDVWTYAGDYITKLLGDIQGFDRGQSQGSKVLSKLRSGYVVASLGLNIKVMLTQFASYPTAFSMLRASSLAKAFTRKLSFKEMDEYSEYANVRNALGDATKAEGADNSQGKIAKVMMMPIQKVDRFTIGMLWNACKFEVQARHSGDDTYKFGTEENKKEAAVLLEDVSRRTQPNYTTTERTGIQRSNSELIRWTLGSFTSVPSKMLSRLVESALNVRAMWYKEHKLGESVSQEEKRAIGIKFVKSVTAVTMSNLMYVLIAQAMKYALAKDRKDKDGNEIEWWEDMLIDYGSVSAGMIPFFKDLYSSFVQGYDFSGATFSTSAISDIISLSGDFIDMISSMANGKTTSTNAIMGLVKKLSLSVSTMLGIPTRNVYNQLYGIIKRFDPSAAYQMNSIFYSTSNYSKDLNSAMEKGDTDLANTIMGLMLKEKGITKLSDKVTDKMRDLYEKGYNVLPRTIGDSVTIDGEEYTLSAQQQKKIKSVYDDANAKVEKLINGQGFNSLDSKVQAKAIKWIYDYYYEYAVAATLGLTADSKKLLYGETMSVERFALAISVCSSITSDIDKKGNKVANSKKNKIIAMLRQSGMSKAEREMILAYLGYSVDESIITRYIRSLGLSKNQQKIFKSYVSFAQAA